MTGRRVLNDPKSIIRRVFVHNVNVMKTVLRRPHLGSANTANELVGLSQASFFGHNVVAFPSVWSWAYEYSFTAVVFCLLLLYSVSSKSAISRQDLVIRPAHLVGFLPEVELLPAGDLAGFPADISDDDGEEDQVAEEADNSVPSASLHLKGQALRKNLLLLRKKKIELTLKMQQQQQERASPTNAAASKDDEATPVRQLPLRRTSTDGRYCLLEAVVSEATQSTGDQREQAGGTRSKSPSVSQSNGGNEKRDCKMRAESSGSNRSRRIVERYY